MNSIQYKIKPKKKCRACNWEGIPYVKMVIFKNTESYSCAAYCPKCGKYIENVPKSEMQKEKIK